MLYHIALYLLYFPTVFLFLDKGLHPGNRTAQNQCYWHTLVSAQRHQAYRLTMNIALALIGLHNKQIGHMTGNVVLITCSITTEHLLQTEKYRQQSSKNIQVKPKRLGWGKHTLESWQVPDHSSGA